MERRARTLGRVLQLSQGIVGCTPEPTSSNPHEPLFHIINWFVKQVEPKPTWRFILAALRHDLIKEHSLAQEIEESFVQKTASDSDAQCKSTTVPRQPSLISADPQLASATPWMPAGAQPSSTVEGLGFAERKPATARAKQPSTIPRLTPHSKLIGTTFE